VATIPRLNTSGYSLDLHTRPGGRLLFWGSTCGSICSSVRPSVRGTVTQYGPTYFKSRPKCSWMVSLSFHYILVKVKGQAQRPENVEIVFGR